MAVHLKIEFNSNRMTRNEPRALSSPAVSAIRALGCCLTMLVLLTQPAAAGLVYQLVYESQPIGFGAPYGALVLASDGNFYGTTASALGGFGTIFRVSPAGALTALFSFNGTNGINPTALIEGRDGNLYGTTQYGGVGYM